MNHAPRYRRRRRVAVAIAVTVVAWPLMRCTAETPDAPQCPTNQTAQQCHTTGDTNK